MKLLKIILATIMLSALTQKAIAQDATKNQKAIIQTAIYCDHCKACESCGKNLQSKILKINGVRMYELDGKKK